MKTKKIVSIMLAFVMLAALSISASAVTIYNKSDLTPKAEVATVDFSKYTQNEAYVSVTGNAGEINNFNGDWKYVERWDGDENDNGPSAAKIQKSKLTLKGTTDSTDLSTAGVAIRSRVIAYMSDSLKNLANNYKVSFDFHKQSSNSDLMFRFNIPNADRSNFYALVLPQPNKYASQPVWSLYQYTTASNTVRTDLMTSERTTSGFIDNDNYNYVKDGKVTISVVDNAITVNLYCSATVAAGEGNTSYVFNETKTVTPANPISAEASETFAGFCVLGTAYTEISSLKFENIPEIITSVLSVEDGFNYTDKAIISVTSSGTPNLTNTYYPVDTKKNWYVRYGTLNDVATTSAGIEEGKLKLGNGPAQSVDGNGNHAWTLYRPNISEVRTKYADWGIDNWNDDWQLSFEGVLTTTPARLIALLDYYCDDESVSMDYYAVQITGNFSDAGIKLYKHTSDGWELLKEDNTVISTDKLSNDVSTDNVTISKLGDTLSVEVYNTSYPSVVASVSYTEPNMFSNEKATFGFTQLTSSSNTERYVYVDNVKFVKNVEFIKDGTSDMEESFAYADTEYLYDVDTQPTAGAYEQIDASGNWYTDYTEVNDFGNVRAKISGGELAMTGGPTKSIEDNTFNRGWTLYRPDCDEVLGSFGEWGLKGWSGDYKLSFDGKLNKTTTRFSAVFDYASENDDYYMVQVNGGYNNSPCFELYKYIAGVEDIVTLYIDNFTFYDVFTNNTISKVTFRVEITKTGNTITAVLYNKNNGAEITGFTYTDEEAPQHSVATLGFTENSLLGSNQEQFYQREAYVDNVSFVAYDEEADSSIMLNYGYKNIGENGNVLFGEYEDGVLKRVLVGDSNDTSVEFSGYNPFRTYKAFFWNEFMPLQAPDTIN